MKTKVGILMASVLALSALAAAAEADSGLVGHWKLQGDCKDYSGRGNDGINHGVDLSLNGAARFDGKSSFIEVPDNDSLDLGAGDFTIAAWIKCDAGTAQVVGDIVNKYDPDRRKGINLGVSASSPGYSSVSDARNLRFGIDNAAEGEWIDCGRPLPENSLISTLIVYQGQLYTGIADAIDPRKACHVYRYAGGQKWEDCGRVGDNPKVPSIMTVCIHKGRLYAGTGAWIYDKLRNYGHPGVYCYEGGAKWRDCGLTIPGNRIMTLASFKGTLFASDDAANLYRYVNGDHWVPCGKVQEYKVISFMVFQDNLYGGASTMIHRYGGDWKWDGVAKFIPEEINQIHTLSVYQGNLYAGTWPRGRIMRRDGDNNWVVCAETGDLAETAMGKPRTSYSNEINELTVYNGKMYAGVIPKGEVWRYEGEGKATMLKRLVHNPDYSSTVHLSWRRVPCMTVYRGHLFCGTATATGAAVAKPVDEAGKVFSWEAGKCVSYDDDLGASWRHVAAVREKNRLKLYVDGKLVAATAAFEGARFDLTNGKPLRIGFGAENYFRGAMRDVRLYNRALNPSQIQR